jgi:nascent polypeptide-associated complex subunit alpha
MYQITGGATHERSPSTEVVSTELPEGDVKLVAEQTGKTLDEARSALKEAAGDLAEAILKLKPKNQA